MAIKFVPQGSEGIALAEASAQATIENQAQNEVLLESIVNGTHRVEMQLEKITDEKIDDDEKEIC